MAFGEGAGQDGIAAMAAVAGDAAQVVAQAAPGAAQVVAQAAPGAAQAPQVALGLELLGELSPVGLGDLTPAVSPSKLEGHVEVAKVFCAEAFRVLFETKP